VRLCIYLDHQNLFLLCISKEMSLDKEEFDQLIQEIIRDVIPKLKSICITNEFLESVFKKKETRSEESVPPVKIDKS
jgi:hypothetical protein